MSKVRDLPQITTLDDNDLLYAVDFSAGPNGGRKITKADLKTNIALTSSEVKTEYESNPDTNAFTDAEKTKLASVFAGAKFQQASEVPYSNTVSGLTATDVQSAIDEVNTKAQADFRPSIVANRILGYSGGTARFDGVFYSILANDILLNPNITNGEVYVDLDGIVKQTASNTSAPPYTIVFAKFSTDLNTITALSDERVKNAQNIVRGILADVRDVRAGAAADPGSSGRVSDAMHKHNILTAAASGQTPDQSNAEGTSTSLARADHTHNIPTAIAVDIAAANAQGSAAAFARADHTHKGLHSIKANLGTQRFLDVSLVNGLGINIVDDGSGNFTFDTNLGPNELVITQGTGLVANYSAGRVRINGTTYSIGASTLSVAPSATNGRIYVDVDGVVKSTTSTSTPPNAIPLAIYSSSVSAITALSDNRTLLNPNITLGLAGDIATLNASAAAAAGSTNKYADAGHVHPISTGAPSTQNPDQANAAGASANLARADHTHNIPTAAPTTALSPATTNAQGAGTSFARNDHTHAVATGVVGDITTIQPDDAAAAGSVDRFARADHKHAIVAAAATSISTTSTNTEGASTSFARADHTHAVSVASQEATATADDTTTSLTDTLMNSMSITPAAGTYWVIWHGSILNSANGSERTWVSLYSGGSQVSATERSMGTAGGAYVPAMTGAVITVNGSQAIELRWRVAGGTSTVRSRRLSLLRIG